MSEELTLGERLVSLKSRGESSLQGGSRTTKATSRRQTVRGGEKAAEDGKHINKKKKERPKELPISRRQERYVGRGDDLQSEKPKRKAMDPRFAEHCGEFNQGLFEKSYSFVDDMRTKEKEELREKISKEKNAANKQELIRKQTALEARLESEKAEKVRREIKRKFKAEEKDRVKNGKKPFFLSKRKLRDLELEAKFDELKSSGKLKKYIEKRRKKQASKDKKMLPPRENST